MDGPKMTVERTFLGYTYVRSQVDKIEWSRSLLNKSTINNYLQVHLLLGNGKDSFDGSSLRLRVGVNCKNVNNSNVLFASIKNSPQFKRYGCLYFFLDESTTSITRDVENGKINELGDVERQHTAYVIPVARCESNKIL